MKPLRWLIDLHPDFPGSAAVAARLRELGRPEPVVVERRAAMIGDWPAIEPPLVAYGTMLTMTRLRRHPRLGAAVFDDYAALRCSSYYAHVHDLLGRAFFFAPFGALPHLPLGRMLGERVFIRSDTNYKLFPASVLPVAEVGRWVETYAEHRTELAVVAEEVQFDAEYRCFCRDGAFFCGSSYPAEPYREVPPEVRAFAEIAARRLAPSGMNMVTVDVGLTGSGPRIVEMGGVNSWGVYGSNIDDFLHAMESEALRRWADLA